MSTLKIKTPIWTGDIDSKSDSLQSTGIMGSLRWWTEAILRGMGKFTCDPVDDNSRSSTKRCPIPKENKQDIAQYCPACLIFGATGMRRIFRLHMNGGEKIFSGGSINITPTGRNRGWYLGSGLVGNINLDVISLDKNFEENLILVPLAIAAKWGGLGAKTQHGYGVVELENYPEIKFDSFKETLKAVLKKERIEKLKIEGRSGDYNLLPNIKEMFFAKVQFEAQNDNYWKEVDGIKERGRKGDRNYYDGYINDSRMVNWVNAGSIPIAPAIKNWLRFGGGKSLWKTEDYNKDRRIENWLFGSIRNDKSASKINISSAYRINNSLWEFRVWGWIPENNLPNGFDRDDFLNMLNESLGRKSSLEADSAAKIVCRTCFTEVNIDKKNRNNYWCPNCKQSLKSEKTLEWQLKAWREYNSARDTVKQNEINIETHLQSLINGEEKK